VKIAGMSRMQIDDQPPQDDRVVFTLGRFEIASLVTFSLSLRCNADAANPR